MLKKYYVFLIGTFITIFYTFSSTLNPAQITKVNITNDFTTVEGRVTFSDMTGASAHVKLINEYDSSVYEDTTDSEGYYRIENIQTSVREIINQGQDEFSIYSNYPNPIGDDTIIPFRTNQSGEVTIIIYNILGKEVDKRTYLMETGLHGVRYVPKGAGGVQFYKIISGGEVQVKKFVTLDAFADGGLKEEVTANLPSDRLHAKSLTKTDQVEQSMKQLFTIYVHSLDSTFEEIINYNVPIARDTTLNFIVNRTTPQILVLDTDTLHFDSDQNQLEFTLENGGTDTLSWSIAGNADWLMYYATTGNTVSEDEHITVAVARSGLTAGMYDGTLTITSNGGTATIDVSMDVSPISLSTTNIHFTSSDTTHTFFITNCDTGSFDWHISVTEDWILVDPQSGTTTTEIDTIYVTIDDNYNLSDSTKGSIFVSPGLAKSTGSSGSGSSQIDVTNPDYTGPVLEVFGSTEFICRHHLSMPFFLTNISGYENSNVLNWQIISNNNWISVDPNVGSAFNDDVVHDILVSQEPAGFERTKLYIGTIMVISNGGFKQLTVKSHDPTGAVTPENLDFKSDLTSLSFEIYNKGTGSATSAWLHWTLKSPEVSWVLPVWAGGLGGQGVLYIQIPTDEVIVNVDRTGLAPGHYETTLTVEHMCCDQRIESSDIAVSMDVCNYSIDYDHTIITEQGNITITTTITGQIPIFLDDSDNTLEGSGSLDIAMAGCGEMGESTIDIVGSGTGSVTIDGKKIPKDQGDPDLEINFTEIWYQNCQQIWTYHLPDGDEEQTLIIPEGSNNHTLTFPLVDGHVITASFESGGGTGVLTWTLNVYQ